ncbi:MAG: hypothetical protein HY657_06610 [Acidobacteria bacterium]|nr:hypothetical protein [Acidobacteriota bacterium]
MRVGARLATAQGDPDALYRERADVEKARAAAALWEARLAADPADFESAWKLARAMYWLGGRGAEDERRAALERGVAAGRTAAMLEPRRSEGHFWMAANMGALAESFGLRQGLRYRGAIRDALETVLRLDPAFQAGSADRALGRWYFKVPRLFGGSKDKAEEHLRASLKHDPDSTASLYFLAELLLDRDRDRDAVAALEAVLAAPLDPEWEPEDREFKEKARRLLVSVRP